MKRTTESKEQLVNSSQDLSLAQSDIEAGSSKNEFESEIQEIVLTAIEKKFLLSAERGDCATVRRLIDENKDKPEELDINCVDPLNRSSLIAAIENENIELIMLLLQAGIKVKDALLHAIKEEYVEAVETLLQWEEENHLPGMPYSWEAVDRSSSTFTPDITPLILAAHKNNYEIIKLLLDRGATLPMPHDVRCGCDECVVSSREDSLRHSQSRINAYRALTSSSLIALSSRDPILTAFQLSAELRRLSRMETEFRADYNQMRKNCQEFATALLDHARTSNELEIMLNYNADGDNWEPGERQSLERLKMAIKYKQKIFVAHPNVQQLLAAIWYEGLPGFRRKGPVGQIVQVAKLGTMFPAYSTMYILAPYSEMALFMKKPFVKFICHSSSYAVFLTFLGAASQRIDHVIIELIGTPWMKSLLEDWRKHERGAFPGIFECFVILYVLSYIFGEIKALWSDGLLEYISDLWNIVDFISNSFYVMWMSLRFTSWYIVNRDASRGLNPWYPREEWDPYDPMLLSEGAFAAGMIFSFLKLVHIFSINPHLGPLQVSLGRMIIDIIKFFFIYTLVLFAFGCGLNQLMWYYADLEKQKCYHLPSGLPDFDNHEKACSIWRRFANLFETSQSLFWASFGLVDLMAFELQGIKSFTRFWALLMFGSYSVINIIVLLNMLIAMMSNSYQIISERSDCEWKFARSHLWMSYFEDGDTVPAPFNLFPSTKLVYKIFKCGKEKRSTNSIMKKSREKAQRRHDRVMRLLVRRYVTAEQSKRDDYGVTEDDVMEIRQDISTLRYELIDILQQNGMRTPNIKPQDGSIIAGKKGRVMERRILKDFQIGIVEGIVNDAITSNKESTDVFSQIAKAIGKRSSHKKEKEDWNALVRKNTVVRDPIGSTTEALNRRSRQSLRRQILDNSKEGLEMDTDNLIEFNPKLSDVSQKTRVAYVKFMTNKLKRDAIDADETGADIVNERQSASDSKRSSTKSAIHLLSNSLTRSISITEKNADVMKDEPNKEPSPKKDNLQTSSTAEKEKDSFRSRTPIQEDPNEDRIQSPELIRGRELASCSTSSAGTSHPSSAIPPMSPEKQTATEPAPSPSPRPSLTPSTSKALASPRNSLTKPSTPAEPSQQTPPPAPSKTLNKDDEDEDDDEDDDEQRDTVPDIKSKPEVKVEYSQLTTDKGKSKITGKTLTGWL